MTDQVNGAPAEKLIEVAAGLIFRAGRLLLTQRHSHDRLGGLWEFPGGKLELGESYADCLRRELREELGLEVVVGELVEQITHRYPERSVHLKFFRCAIATGDPRPLGCQDLAWVTAAELARYEFPAADARLLDRLVATPAWWTE
ncbi:MAG: 8-oxo-dGTP diphosphatase MutT [Verrucomicrobia bacterium]|nr:8-oxo-dGTP diphosphatase MutT [Verrucomicrobiota bacterium]